MLPAPIRVVAAVIERDGAFLLTRRLAGTHLEGLWEFPGGKCHDGESHEAALRRELWEELGVDVKVQGKVMEVIHEYPDRIVELHFYTCDIAGTPSALLGQEMRWVPRAGLLDLEFPPADRELIVALSENKAQG